MPRLFTGLEIPAAIVSRLASLRAGLSGARWVDPENYHLTLRFVGDIDDRAARDFAGALAEIRCDSFDVAVNGLGSFGGRKPRAIWAGIAPSDALMRLQKAHDRAARQVGLPPDPRNFAPHVTLARLKITKPDAVARYLTAYGGFVSEPFRVRRFVLFSARANQGGGPYVVEEAYALGEDYDAGDVA